MKAAVSLFIAVILLAILSGPALAIRAGGCYRRNIPRPIFVPPYHAHR